MSKRDHITLMAGQLIGLLLLTAGLSAQHPRIWVRDGERQLVLDRIADQEAVGAYFTAFRGRVVSEVARYAEDPAAYLAGLPELRPYTDFSGTAREEQNALRRSVQTAVDCGVLYWLTEEEHYARYAAGQLQYVVRGLQRLPPAPARHNSGWLYPRDHLREARELGAQLPLIYDFIHDYLADGGTVYDPSVGRRAAADTAAMQATFRTYAGLAVEQGIINCNWPILEMPSLIHNTLVLEDDSLRDSLLGYVLVDGGRHQDALPKIAAHYDEYGGTWPESLNYATAVSELLTYVLGLFKHHDPGSDLAQRYPQPIAALADAYRLTYPDGQQTLLYGDGHRPYRPNFTGYEMAHHLGQLYGREDWSRQFAALIATGVEAGRHRRFQLGEREFPAHPYFEPLQLLWYPATVDAEAGDYPLPVTDELPFAGITLQRMPSPAGNPADALMYFVGGGAYVHGHASGMNAEFYGRGHVLGTKAGRGSYRTEIHENYYRLFAGHNTVVASGQGGAAGGWAALGINRTERVTAEPAPGRSPLSPAHAFSVSKFVDDRRDAPPAEQQRTVGMVRTSDSTGFYVDIFRSRTGAAGEFHDYIYHNIGDTLLLPLRLSPAPDRYAAAGKQKWTNNKLARHPGWQYFDHIRHSGPYQGEVTATFRAGRLGERGVNMQLRIPGEPGRAYTAVRAPPSTESSPPYRNRPTPTLVIRQEGDAWERPFALLLEPSERGGAANISADRIGGDPATTAGTVALRVGTNDRASRRQYILLCGDGEAATFSSADHGLSFTGRYAVLTSDANGRLREIYLGSGSRLTYRGFDLQLSGDRAGAAYLKLDQAGPRIESEHHVRLRMPDGTIHTNK